MVKKHAFGDSQGRILTNEMLKSTKTDADSLHEKINVHRSRQRVPMSRIGASRT